MSKLYLVPTPIGNLKDMSFRALEILGAVDRVACEDTRVTGKLLQKYELKKPLLNYREHNEIEASEYILDLIEAGETIALVTDAGMPGISDPGETLVRKAVDRGIEVNVIPGPSALINALVSSGLPTRHFTFLGFLDKTKKKKRDELALYEEREETLIIYEAPHRIIDTLEAVLEVLGERSISLSRELTKLYEEHLRGSVSGVLKKLQEKPIKGEFVLVIKGKTLEEKHRELEVGYENLTLKEHVKMLIDQGFSKKEAIKQVASLRGLPKNQVYQESLDLQANDE